MHSEQPMTTSDKSHARVEETVSGGSVTNRISMMSDSLDKFDALAVHAAHARERDGEIKVATIEHSVKMAVRVVKSS